MTTEAVETRKHRYEVSSPQVGAKKAYPKADNAASGRARMWVLIGDLVILGIALLATLAAISKIAHGTSHSQSASHISQSRLFQVEPVIQAWRPWDQAPLPLWPNQEDQWKRSPPAAIVTPVGIDVIEKMHRNDLQWRSPLAPVLG